MTHKRRLSKQITRILLRIVQIECNRIARDNAIICGTIRIALLALTMRTTVCKHSAPST